MIKAYTMGTVYTGDEYTKFSEIITKQATKQHLFPQKLLK